MDSYGLKRVALTDTMHTSGAMFEYPHLRDVLYQPNDLFEGRELHCIEWNASANGGIKMPRLSFLGDDQNGIITTGNYVAETRHLITTFSNKVTVPQSGICGVKVRATEQWVREIIFYGKNNVKLAHLETGCNEGSYVESEFTEDEEIVGMFGTIDSNMHLKSFGLIVHTQ